VLLRTLFLLLLIATLIETVVHGVHASVQAALRRQAAAAVRGQLETSTTLAREAVARAIETGGDPRDPQPVPPSPAPACRLHGPHGCAIEGIARIEFRAEDGNNPGTPAPCPSPSCTAYLQGNDAVDEGRVAATIQAEAVTAGGAVLAARTVRVTFRTLREPPYAALAGQADESLEGASGTSGAGDDAGAAPNGAAPGTLIDVLYENAATGATIPANVWRSRVQSLGATPRAWSP
jgi:hypothetical protein